ncbi:hypothetical protein PoB_002249500 [Plakobranchus ocellatus]|uniref:Fibronectin type-III domain-containing protein n=1 Tax=Plakobranchus ocellatus TaxID=259542 RepID=A0AAV3ZK00_9GAST|nr:hypothetical protein PoB_002249500 [Plakobranchus ocellatus]
MLFVWARQTEAPASCLRGCCCRCLLVFVVLMTSDFGDCGQTPARQDRELDTNRLAGPGFFHPPPELPRAGQTNVSHFEKPPGSPGLNEMSPDLVDFNSTKESFPPEAGQNQLQEGILVHTEPVLPNINFSKPLEHNTTLNVLSTRNGLDFAARTDDIRDLPQQSNQTFERSRSLYKKVTHESIKLSGNISSSTAGVRGNVTHMPITSFFTSSVGQAVSTLHSKGVLVTQTLELTKDSSHRNPLIRTGTQASIESVRNSSDPPITIYSRERLSEGATNSVFGNATSSFKPVHKASAEASLAQTQSALRHPDAEFPKQSTSRFMVPHQMAASSPFRKDPSEPIPEKETIMTNNSHGTDTSNPSSFMESNLDASTKQPAPRDSITLKVLGRKQDAPEKEQTEIDLERPPTRDQHVEATDNREVRRRLESPRVRTTQKNVIRFTEQAATAHKATVKKRRSTQDPKDIKSTLKLMSSKKGSSDATQSKVLTSAVASHASDFRTIAPIKRHVPRESGDMHNYTTNGTSSGAVWPVDAILRVSLDGNGEALTVTWEYIPGSSTGVTHLSDSQTLRAFRTGGISSQQESSSESKANKSEHSSNMQSDSMNVQSEADLVNGFVVSYHIPGDEEYDSSRLGPRVRSFTLHQLHPDEDYIICVHALAGQKRIHEECANWHRSSLKLVVGVLAGTIFLLPCLVILVMIIYKDRKMRARKPGQGGSWDEEHQELARAFASCEESHEALVRNSQGDSSYTQTSQSNSVSNDRCSANNLSGDIVAECTRDQENLHLHQNHLWHSEVRGASNVELIRQGSPSSSSNPHISIGGDTANGALITRNTEAITPIDSKLPLEYEVLQDANNSIFPQTSPATGRAAISIPTLPTGAERGCDRETRI